MAKLQDLITSRVRVKILELFFTNANELYYIREATRLVSEEINAVFAARRSTAHADLALKEASRISRASISRINEVQSVLDAESIFDGEGDIPVACDLTALCAEILGRNDDVFAAEKMRTVVF